MKIPTYNPQTRPTNQPLIASNGGNPSAEAFGAGIGRGLQNLAQGAGQFAAYIAENDRSRRRFADMRKFSAFQTSVNDELSRMGREHDPSTGNFSEFARARFADMEREFINEQVDPEFRDEFAVRTGEMGNGIATKSLAFQLESNDAWFRRELNSSFDDSKIALSQNPTIENLNGQRQQMLELLAASGLTEEEQAVKFREFNAGLEVIAYKQAQVQRLLTEDESESETAAASVLIGAFAGGTEEEQKQLALEGKQLAISSLAGQGGTQEALNASKLWNAMPARARAALASVASELGELPPEVVQAVMSGDLEAISESIRELGGERRTQEADLVLNPGAQIDDDPNFSNVTYEDRIALLEDAKQQVVAIETAATKAQNAQDEALVNAAKIALSDGTAGMVEIDRVREMLGDRLKYEDLAQMQRIYDDRNEGLGMVQQGQAMRAAGLMFNPLDEDHKKILNAMLGEEGKKALQARDGNFAANGLIPLVRDVGDIPIDAIGTLMGMMRSGNQDDALWALDAFHQLDQASPKAYLDRVDEPTRSAVEFWRQRKDFYTPEKLLSLINGGNTTEERQQTKMLREEAKDVLKTATFKKFDVATDFQTGVWGYTASQTSLPWAARAMNADFDRIFEDQYSLYGDVDKARAATVKLMNDVWSPTTIGQDGKVMKYPPEKAGYPEIAGSYKWMEEQVYAEGVIAEGQGFELVSDADTEREVDAFKKGGPPPSYLLVRVVDGRPELVMEGGANLDPFGNVVEVTPVHPRRQYFEITPLEQEKQRAWRELNEANAEQSLLMRNLEAAEAHSLETGIPIPEDAEGFELLQLLMNETPENVQQMFTGDPDNQVGIATGEYRLP